MSASCCGHTTTFDGLSADYKRRLWLVIAINASMFLVEMGAGTLAGSQALQADALDFLGDSLTYGLSLAVIGAALPVRAWAAFAKGVSLTLMGLWVFGSTAYHVLALGVPRAEVMGVIGILALAANVGSVFLLMRYKDGDANVRSVWLCSRNDAIGNVAVMMAALGHGVETCAQQAFARYHQVIRAQLAIPDSEIVVCGMSLGYADPAEPANRLRSTREPVEAFARFAGW